MASHPEAGGEERRTGAGHKQLQVVVVTPEKTLLDETVDFVALPLYDGELGVLPGRAPLIGRLGYGELRTKQEETVHPTPPGPVCEESPRGSSEQVQGQARPRPAHSVRSMWP